MFSTFIKWEAGRFRGWIPDPKLRRSMQSALDNPPDRPDSERRDPESFWVKHWHQIWQSQTASLAELHLYAYLQEPMYWAAGTMLNKFTSSQRNLEDYFQDLPSYVRIVLKKFDATAGNMKSLAGVIFLNSLRADVRRKGEASLCTTWGLLKKVGKKRLAEALEQGGLSKDLINQYCLAWKCFKAVYVPIQLGGTQRLPEPTPEQWEAIANLYNQERLNLVPPAQVGRAILIKQWLTHAESLARREMYPAVKSLNAPSEDGSSVETDIPDGPGSLVDVLIETENIWDRQTQQSEVFQVLMDTLNGFDPEWQQVLKLYYCEDLTLQQIAAHLAKPYTWVQRRVARSHKRLLEALVEWGQMGEAHQGEVNISLIPDQVKRRGAVLEEWLKIRSCNFL
jgi:RNA polymerase sigma factor (sigma-70 family)